MNSEDSLHGANVAFSHLKGNTQKVAETAILQLAKWQPQRGFFVTREFPRLIKNLNHKKSNHPYKYNMASASSSNHPSKRMNEIEKKRYFVVSFLR